MNRKKWPNNATRKISLFLLGAALFLINASAADNENKKILTHTFKDNVTLRVHYLHEGRESQAASDEFARHVLDSAVYAYQTITDVLGFSSQGYSFARPSKDYAFDSDRIIDIYLGQPTDDVLWPDLASGGLSFRDAPCFDTLKHGQNRFEAVILLPAHYREFIKNWETVNPSSLGKRNIEVDLRGTLMHEMLHTILFYYNKNLNKEEKSQTSLSEPSQIDWYVEGLARYFETYAGARHDFYSQGFRETLPDKIRFSRGGSNFFMRYPDQAFTDLRYENALFWRYMDYRYGMEKIERMSRDFRETSSPGFESLLQKATGSSIRDFLQKYAVAILWKDFGLKEEVGYLMDVARTRLTLGPQGYFLVDSQKAKVLLGETCRTDWVGEWGQVKAKLGEAGAAGDNTAKSDVSGWATDYYEVGIDATLKNFPAIGVRHLGGGQELLVQIIVESKGGFHLMRALKGLGPGEVRQVEVEPWLESEGLEISDVHKVYILVINTDHQKTSDYELLARP